MNLDVLFQQATLAYQRRDLKNAEQLYRSILNISPNHLGAISMLGSLSVELGNNLEAIKLLRASLKRDPKQFWLYNSLGVAYLNLEEHKYALLNFNKAIDLSPKFVDAYFNLGNVFRALKKYIDAVESYTKCLGLDGSYIDAYINRGCIFLDELKEYEKARSDFLKIVELMPNSYIGYYNLGNLEIKLENYEVALDWYTKAMGIDKNQPKILNGLAVNLGLLKRYDEAFDIFDKAITLNSKYSESYFNRGVLLAQLQRYDESLKDYEQAIALNPIYTEAYANKAVILYRLKRYADSLAYYERAIQLDPNNPKLFRNRALVFAEVKCYEDALADYKKALDLKPDFAEAFFNRASIFSILGRHDEALETLDQAVKIDRQQPYLLGDYLNAKMNVCDWSDFYLLINEFIEKVNINERVAIPFIALSLVDDPQIHKAVAQSFIESNYPSAGSIEKKYPAHRKIRIGYFSPDFREHPVSYLTAELFELHNRDQFEIFAFSLTQDKHGSKLRKRLELAFDHFIDVSDRSDEDILQLARSLEIDIGVDLGGFTQDCRTRIFSMRVAPIQIGYIGYLGTMGTVYYDYLIADKVIIPKESQKFYTEKIMYLPWYQSNDSKLEIARNKLDRQTLGLPNNSFVFCCFNNTYKITPEVFDSWINILKAVDGSVLWLFGSNNSTIANLRKEAELRGLDSSRLIFGNRMPLSEHIARYRSADLFLDTSPYNAGTTASDALRVGLPVLTMIGKSFPSRVAASILNAVNLQELITSSREEYESLAISLAIDKLRYHQLRLKLKHNLQTCNLYNSRAFVSNIESAYREAYLCYQNNQDIDNIEV